MAKAYDIEFEDGNITLYWLPGSIEPTLKFDNGVETDISKIGQMFSGKWRGTGKVGIAMDWGNIEHSRWYYELRDPEVPLIRISNRFEVGNGAMNLDENMVTDICLELKVTTFPLRKGASGTGTNYHAGNYRTYNFGSQEHPREVTMESGVAIHWTCTAAQERAMRRS